jgi:hypothetical protein
LKFIFAILKFGRTRRAVGSPANSRWNVKNSRFRWPLYYTAALNLHIVILYSFCCRSFIYFRRAKVAKRPARGKISQALLCSGIAAQYPSVEKPLLLELAFCFTALRNLCGMVL